MRAATLTQSPNTSSSFSITGRIAFDPSRGLAGYRSCSARATACQPRLRGGRGVGKTHISSFADACTTRPPRAEGRIPQDSEAKPEGLEGELVAQTFVEPVCRSRRRKRTVRRDPESAWREYSFAVMRWGAILLLLACTGAFAQAVGFLPLVEGKVSLVRGAGVHAVVEGARVQEGDILATAPNSQAHIQLQGGSLLNLGPGTRLMLMRVAPARGESEVAMLSGWLKVSHKNLNPERRFAITSPTRKGERRRDRPCPRRARMRKLSRTGA